MSQHHNGAQRVNSGLITNHCALLLHVSRKPDCTMREMAEHLGLSERTIIRLLKDLADGRYLRFRKVGRRNSYRVLGDALTARSGSAEVSVSRRKLTAIRCGQCGERLSLKNTKTKRRSLAKTAASSHPGEGLDTSGNWTRSEGRRIIQLGSRASV